MNTDGGQSNSHLVHQQPCDQTQSEQPQLLPHILTTMVPLAPLKWSPQPSTLSIINHIIHHLPSCPAPHYPQPGHCCLTCHQFWLFHHLPPPIPTMFALVTTQYGHAVHLVVYHKHMTTILTTIYSVTAISTTPSITWKPQCWPNNHIVTFTLKDAKKTIDYVAFTTKMLIIKYVFLIARWMNYEQSNSPSKYAFM